MFSGVFESSEHIVSHARNTLPRTSTPDEAAVSCFTGPAHSAQLLVPHSSKPASGDIFFWIQDSRAKYMSARSLVSLSSTSRRWLQCTMRRRKAEHRGRGDDPLEGARHYILSRSRACILPS